MRDLPRQCRAGESGDRGEHDRLRPLIPPSAGARADWAFYGATAAVFALLLSFGFFLGTRPHDLPGVLLILLGTGVGVALTRWLVGRWMTPGRHLLERNVASLEATNRELIEARAEIVRAARLATVGTLAAGIAHEVGNPLGAIMGYVDVARTRAKRGEVDSELLDSIRSEAQRIDRIVKSLLNYARPGEERLEVHAPGTVVGRVRDLLDAQGKLNGVDARWDVAPDTPDVLMNPHRLEQVLVNLLLNGLEAMEGSSRKELRVRLYGGRGEVTGLPTRREDDPPGVNYMHRRRVSRDDGGRGVDPVFVSERIAVLEVDDSGPGIPEEDLERVFDPFFTTKEPGRGTGLGLSICGRLVEGMGGRIDAGHAPGGGARFIIRLPAVRHSGTEGRSEAT